MPFPLLLIPIIASATAGTYTAIAGASNLSDAKRRIQAAQDRWKRAASLFNSQLRKTEKRVQTFQKHRQEVYEDFFPKLIEELAKLRLEGRIHSLAELGDLKVELPDLASFCVKIDGVVTTVLKAMTNGILAGNATAMGMTAAVGTWATASTGTAIGTLSGAAATKATLAWFGGGSLATGGLGVAGGSAVLGGVVAAPVVLFVGLGLLRKGEKALTQATEFEDWVDLKKKTLEQQSLRLKLIEQRTQELSNLIDDLHQRALAQLSRLTSTEGNVQNPAFLRELTVLLELSHALRKALDLSPLEADSSTKT